jgi:hypothetical protein
MGPLHAIQTAASLFVLTVIALAESSALLLARFPSVELLWYLNQDVFRFMETGRQFLPSPSVLFLGPATLYWDLGLIVVTLLVYRLRWRFGVAVISHVCLIFTAILTYVWVADRNLPKTVSLDPLVGAFSQVNGALILLMAGAALLAAILAHLTYLIKIGSVWLGGLTFFHK